MKKAADELAHLIIYPSHKLSITHKVQITKLRPIDIDILNMTDVILHQGAKKHGAFSWQINPVESDSTVENNLSAILRHLTMIQQGRYIDDDDYPHVFHLACRACMLVTVNLRHFGGHLNGYVSSDQANYTSCKDVPFKHYLAPEMILMFGAKQEYEAENDAASKETNSDKLGLMLVGEIYDYISHPHLDAHEIPYLFNRDKKASSIDLLFFHIVDFIHRHTIEKRGAYSRMVFGSSVFSDVQCQVQQILNLKSPLETDSRLL